MSDNVDDRPLYVLRQKVVLGAIDRPRHVLRKPAYLQSGRFHMICFNTNESSLLEFDVDRDIGKGKLELFLSKRLNFS